MKIVIAPDSFKGNLSALEVANLIERGIRRVYSRAKIIKVPMADGGEGTVRSLVDATKGRIIRKEVTGPLEKRVKAFYGILGDKKTAVIEMASASGLPLVPKKKRNPLLTTTYGTGELIKAALDKGCRKIIVGIGGSATVDGGAGMAQALGARLWDKKGREIGFGGGTLGNLERIDVSKLDERIKKTEILVASDVDNPLIGSKGAARVYAPQKGATPSMVQRLEKNLKKYASIIKRDLKKDIKDIPGTGAAGGLGAGLIAFLNAKIRLGVDIVIESVGLEKHLKDADLVITGEGKMDSQTIYGKTPIGVARLAKRYNIPVVAIVGEIGEDAEVVYKHGIDGIMTTTSYPMTRTQAIKKSSQLIPDASEQLIRLIKIKID
ncbi:MAG TPA: glycerate kinase [bacterium]|nr:glycerate kinase [bacterium]